MKTIIDIAQAAGVAKSTVSRYLNGGSVSDETREKIERIIRQYNYVPNTFARSLKAKKTSIIGIIVPRLDSFAVSQMLIGIDDTLRQEQYQMLLANANQETTREIEAIYEFSRQKISGLLFMATKITDEHRQAIAKCNIPVVLIGQDDALLHSVIHDDRQAGYMLGKYVLSKGHRQIAYLGVTEQDDAVGIQRKLGFQQAFEHTTDYDIRYYESGFRMDQAVIAANHLLDQWNPSIVVAATDNIAIGVFKAALSRQIDIPTTLSITGFGDYDITEIMHPALTTVKFHYKDAGQLAATNLIQMIHGDSVQKTTISTCELIVRESVDNR
ncbi:LacI family DNA-binding transcriptional regulator [Paenibacillus kyungheensis]